MDMKVQSRSAGHGMKRTGSDRLRPAQSSSTFMSIDQKHDISYAEEINRR